MKLLTVVTLTLLVALAMACAPAATNTAGPTTTPEPEILSHMLEVLADPEGAAKFVFNPKAIGQGLFVHGRTVTIDVLLQPGWEIDEWVGPVFSVERRTAKIKMDSSQTVVVRLVPASARLATPAPTSELVATPSPTRTLTSNRMPTPTPPPIATPRLPAKSIPEGEFYAEYYNNSFLAGNPVFTRIEARINHNWGLGSPGAGVGSDNFSVRWQGKFLFKGGIYNFAIRTDDGIRVWVDDDLVVDEWRGRGPATYQQEVTLTEGKHIIRTEYFEGARAANVEVLWERLLPIGTPAPNLTPAPTRPPTPVPPTPTPISSPSTKGFEDAAPPVGSVEFRGHYYLRVRQSMSWDKAVAHAKSLGGHLVTINDAAENRFVADLAGRSLWIGLSDDVQEGRFLWVTGESSIFSNWGVGEPNNHNGNEDYTMMGFDTPYDWNDVPEDVSIPFVVEFEPKAGLRATPTPTPGPTPTPAPYGHLGSKAEEARAFAEPILVAISKVPPDFQDDFATDEQNWRRPQREGTIQGTLEIRDGVMRVSGQVGMIRTSTDIFQFGHNFVLQLEARMVQGDFSAEVQVLLRHAGSYQFILHMQSRGQTWALYKRLPAEGVTLVADGIGDISAPGEVTRVLALIKGDQGVIYLNGKPVVYLKDPDLDSAAPIDLQFASASEAVLELDNVKYWDLSNLPQ